MLYKGGEDGAGTWMVEWRRKHVRIRRATGERSKEKAGQVAAFLNDLADRGRWDLLEAIAAGPRKGGLELREVYRMRFDLGKLPNASALRRVDAVAEAWADEPGSRHTAAGRRHVVARLLALKRDATMHDLPGLVATLRARLLGKPRSFNAILMTTRALVRDLCGERSTTYEALESVRVLPYTAKKVRPFTRAELREIMDWLGPIRGRILWTLCLTGMRPAEFFETPWEVDGPLIRVHGTKTKGSDRVVPLVEEPAAVSCTYAAFRQHLAKYPGGRVRPYRARHTFAHWMELARIPRSRRRLYLGHSSRDMTDDYEWSEVVRFVKADAERLRRRVLKTGRVEVQRRGTA